MKKAILSLGFIAATGLALTSCGSATSSENTPLIFSTQEVDKVFNPFYASSATDTTVVGMTQISMLTTDKDGNVAYGDNEAVVVKDYEIVDNGATDEDELETTYYFVLKNNVKFSNGSSLTMKDVLFNLYEYLDPVYTGSSTIYSTEIVGLQEYRTQSADENEQDSYLAQFQLLAQTRMEYLIDACDEIIEDADGSLTVEELRSSLEDYTDTDGYENVVVDFDKACSLFKEELETDFSNSMDSYSDISFKVDGTTYKDLLTTDVEAFLYNEGYLKFDKNTKKLDSSISETAQELKYWSKEKAIETVYNDNIPNNIIEVLLYWNTSSTLYEYLTNYELSKYNEENKDSRLYKNIEGIKFANMNESVTVNNVVYPATNGKDVSDSDKYEVLSITIKGVDPKAIWNFAFTVAPMYYYSDEEHINAFDYVENFGVEYGSSEFQSNVIKDSNKIGVPVGAGAYQVSDAAGKTGNVGAGDFYDGGVIYFARNEHFVLGTPKTKYIRYQVVASNQMLDSLFASQVHFIQPNSNPTNIAKLKAKQNAGIEYKEITTQGYGYIGVNAGLVPSIYVRQIIMHAIDTSLTVEYYGNSAQAIHRSMSKNSWAYPEGCTPYYPYIGGAIPENLDVVNPIYAEFVTDMGYNSGETLSKEDQAEFIRYMLEDLADYTLNGNNVYQGGNNVCKYTFTVAGSESDHPAWSAFTKAAEILNDNGFEITVATDANALKKLTTGSLAVWAAAWSTTIDPDMYQVYHIDSTATSTTNWGYKQIKQNTGGKYDYELSMIEELSEMIENGRKTNDQSKRAAIYSECLDMVMELAIELPTYQRTDLYGYNSKKIDSSSLTQNPTPYVGLISEIWNVSMRTQ